MGEDGGMPDFLSHLDAAAEQFADLAATGELTAPVPACPDWTLAELVVHLGDVHQWARHAVIEGNPNGEPIPVPAPTTQPALAQWYRETAAALSATLRQTDPQAPVWHFGPKPRTASFWSRRQAHELTMHLWDAGASQGIRKPIDPELAEDGVDEVVTLFFPRQVRRGRLKTLEHSLALVASDSGRRYVLAGDGTGSSSAEMAVDATITGPAPTLLLLLWGRTGLDHPELLTAGDSDVARNVLNQPITP
jgi:uncharacterized protein (TIGR03083 family)